MSPMSRKLALVLVVVVTLVLGMAWSEQVSTTASGANNCSTIGVPNPRACCQSFLDLHEAIIECLPRPGLESPCPALCILQRFSVRSLAGNVPVSISRIINYGPKLVTQFDQCKLDLFDFLMGSSFEGDFQRVVCDERLNRFLDCMVKGWFQDCLPIDEPNQTCIELRNRLQLPNCSIAPFFVTPLA